MKAELSAQAAVLGSMLMAPEIAGELFLVVREDDFTDPACRDVFRAAKGLFLSNSTLNAVTVLHALGGDEGAYRSFFADLMNVTPNWPEWRSYADIIRAESMMKRMNDLGTRLAFTKDLAEAQEISNQISAMQVRRADCASSMTDALIMFHNRLDIQRDYLSWGIEDLDNGTLFVERGDFVVIGARPSVGKTALALQFAGHMADEGRKIGFFSLETNVVKLVERIIAAEADVSFGAIKRNELSDDDYCRIATAENRVSKRKMDFINAGGWTVSDIRAHALSKRYDVIFVDYLQIIQSQAKDTYQRVTQISVDLHTFAQQCGVTVIALAQLSRPEKVKVNGKTSEVAPRMGDLRESGQIEQDADVVMMINLADPNNMRSDRELRIVKNKEGLRKKIRLKFIGDRQTFFQKADEADAAPLVAKPARPAKITDPQMTLQMPNERRTLC